MAPPPLDESIFEGQAGHIADHEWIARTINGAVANPFDHGAIGDGSPHPLSERYGASLSAAQDDYPSATSLTQQIDYWALYYALATFPQITLGNHRGGALDLGDGKFVIDDTLLFNLYFGFTIFANGIHAGIVPTSAVAAANKPLLKFTNCYRPLLQNLRLWGSLSGTALPTIVQVHEDHGAIAPDLITSTRFMADRVYFGSDVTPSTKNCVLWTTAGLDQNNDLATISNCQAINFSEAAYRTTHLNSLLHRIESGSISSHVPGAVGVRTGKPDGGSAYAGGGSFDIDKTFISVPSWAADYGEGTYTHPQSMSQVKGGEPPGQHEVQTVSIAGSPSGGTFTLTFEGQTTAGIAYNATAATVESALEALSNLAPADIACAGGPFPATPVVCTFAGVIANTERTVMTANSAGLTGGSSPTVSVAHTAKGYGGKWFRSSSLAVDLRLYVSQSQFGSSEVGATVMDWKAPDSIFEASFCRFGGESGAVVDFGTDDGTFAKFFGGSINCATLIWNGYLVLDGPIDYSGALIASGLSPGAPAKLWAAGVFDNLTDSSSHFRSVQINKSRLAGIAGGFEVTTDESSAPIVRLKGGASKSVQFTLAGTTDHWAFYETTDGAGAQANAHLFNFITGQDAITLKAGGGLGFNGSAAIAKPTVTGSRGGNAALASLLTALASYGLIVDSSS